MESFVPWKRTDLRFPDPCDTLLFDVDGVLIKTSGSFRAADIAVAEYVVGTINGLDWGRAEGRPLLTLEDVKIFKQAGGFNDDWHMCYLLAALYTARLREWRGTPLAERSNREWMELARAAMLAGHGGLEWVRAALPASALPDYELVGQLCREYYWGAEEYRRRFGEEPRYLPDWPGFVQYEELLFPPDLPARLHKAGLRKLGLITGRVGPEVDSALERMAAHCGAAWWEVVISGDDCLKPDPRALRLAIEAVAARGGLYVGDTADDLDLVLNYRRTQAPHEPDFLAVMRVFPEEVDLYRERGADLIVAQVADLLDCLPPGSPHREEDVR
jgi:HAD superfamily phosphatase